MHHYIDDDCSHLTSDLLLARKLGIDVCQWHDRRGSLHIFSPEDEKRISKYKKEKNTLRR